MVPLLLYALYPILWAGAVLHLVTRRGLGSCYPLYGSKLKVARGRGPLQGEEHGTGKCGKGGGYSRGPRVPQVRVFGSRTSLEAHGRDLLGAQVLDIKVLKLKFLTSSYCHEYTKASSSKSG